jgi:predicted GIY-YIG superfamily endonuclease
MFYVYEIINSLGTVEYVGQTSNLKVRKYQHFRKKPTDSSRHGKFYGRQDLFLYPVAEFNTQREALDYEDELTKFWGLLTMGDKIGNHQRGKKQKDNGFPVGVGWNESRKKYTAMINIKGETKFLGRFLTVEEASEAYQQALNKIN